MNTSNSTDQNPLNVNLMLHRLNAYELKLTDYMIENFPNRIKEVDFIQSRAAMASETYRRFYELGMNNDEAEYEASKVLYAGIRYSPFQLVKRVVEQEFHVTEEGELYQFSLQMLALCSPFISETDTQDEQFPGSQAEDLLYTQITGEIATYLERNGMA